MGRHSAPDPDVPDPDEGDEAYPSGPSEPPVDHPHEQYPGADPGHGWVGHDDGPQRESEQADHEYRESDYEQPHYGEPDVGEYVEPGFGYGQYEAYDYHGDIGEHGDHGDVEGPLTPPSAAEDIDAPTRSFAATSRRATGAGRQHGGDWEGGEWTGSHRAIAAKRRGVSTSVITALVAVVVIVGAVILWRFVGGMLSSRSQAAAARCVSGDVTVAVVADPSIANDIKGLAEEYVHNAARVGDRCVKLDVRSADSSQVVGGFVGPWPAELGERPALWIPGSSVSLARLQAVAGKETVSTSRSIVTSPVMFAVRPELKKALAQQNWGALPGLQGNPNSLAELSLPGWGPLRAAFPLTGNGDASYAAAEAIAAAAAPASGPPTAGAGAVTNVLASQPKLADGALATALDALLLDGAPAAAPVHAVATTEQQIYQRSRGLAGARDQLAAWQPVGPTALADYPAVQLTGDWLTREQTTAASDFDKYLHKPETLSKLVAAGFRAANSDAALPKGDVVAFGDVAAPLAVGDDDARATIADAVGAPARTPAVTILLDQSMNTTEGGRSRVANVTAALNARLQTLPPTSSVGLWTFDGVAGRAEVPQGPLVDPVNGEPRSATIRTALDRQTASNGGAVSFTTLRLLYPEALANFREGQQNSVLVITSGPHTDQSLDGAGLQSFVKSTFAPARPVAINVIDFGADPDRPAWEGVAQATGGSYQNLTTSAGPELGAAIATMTG